MPRSLLVLLAGLIVATSACAVAPPPIPPYLRLLRGDQGREVARLELEAEQLEAKGFCKDALGPARRAANLRLRLQGARHWQTVDARWVVDRLSRLINGPAKYAELGKMSATARRLGEEGRHAEASALWQRLLVIARKGLGEEHPSTGIAYNNLAINLLNQGKYAEAQRYFEKALAIWRKVLGEDHPDTASGYNNVAVCRHDQRQHVLAQRYFERALEIRRWVLGEDHRLTVETSESLASCLESQGRYPQAERLYARALTITQQVVGEEHPLTATAFHRLAYCLGSQGKHVQAIATYHRALAIRRRVLGEEHPLVAACYNNLASNLKAQGKYAQALSLHEKSLAIYRKTLGEAHRQTAVSFNNLASVLEDQGRYEEAQPLFEKALDICRQLLGEDHPATALCLNNLGHNLYLQGRYPRARRLYEKSLEIRRQALGENHFLTTTTYKNLADTLEAQEKYALARPLYERVLANVRRVQGEEHPDTAIACVSLASNLRVQGKPAEARRLYEKALNIRRRTLGEDHPDTVVSYFRLALCLFVLGDRRAEEMVEHACRSFQAARLHVGFAGLERASYSSQQSPYHLLAFLRAHAGQADRAWEALEHDLARGLLDEVAARERLLPARERQRLDELRAQTVQLERQMTALAGKDDTESRRQRAQLRKANEGCGLKLRELQARLAREHGPVAGAVYDRQRIQQSLSDDAALLAWLDLGRQSWACLVRRRGLPVWVHLPVSEKQDVDDLSLGLSSPSRNWTEKARQLYEQRLAPLGKYLGAANGLPAVRRLVVLPSPALAGVPVEALLAAGKADFTVSYAPSGTLFAYLQQRRQESKPRPARLLALGDPLFAQPQAVSNDRGTARQQADALLSRALRQSNEPLPGTRGEVEAIASLFPTADTLLGARASEEVLDQWALSGKLKEYRFLHLATHGRASEKRPLESYLALSDRDLPDPLPRVLAGKPAYTGRLTAGQILQSWKLDADLVVLSACQSGLGRYEGGEGYIGFAQPLFAVGARCLVMSLWSVSDKATALLMVRFYQNLLGKRDGLKQPTSKADALNEAKRWLRSLSTEEADRALTKLSPKLKLKESERPKNGRPFEHPFFWAAYILAGDPGSISR
jgi:CHAT domain-containing protein/tetratricopeptide (TPR) repeat protein